MSRGYVHLHNHMEGSYSDSALPMISALDRVKELGMKAFALTDHGEMAIVPEFIREAEARDIKPIVGVEAYFVEDAAVNIRERINQRYHLLLLAQNATGLRNIITMMSRSWKENCLMQKLGLVDWRLLEEHSEGVICLSGCLAGPMAWSYHTNEPQKADQFYGRFSELFRERFFVEVFDHGMPEEKIARDGMLALSKRFDAKIVLTNDCHYLHSQNWDLHDVLIKTRFGRPTDFSLPYHEYFIKSEEEMRSLGYPDEFYDQTIAIADLIQVSSRDIGFTAENFEGERETAFLGIRTPIGRARALEKAAAVAGLSRREQEKVKTLREEVLEKEYGEVIRIAAQIEDLPDKCRPDLGRVVVAPQLSSRIPLRRMETIMYTMWDEDACLRAGAEIVPISEVKDLAETAAAVGAYMKGMTEFRRRRLDRAKDCFLEALEKDPRYVNAIYQYGIVEYYMRDYPAALEAFHDVLEIEPEFERLPHLHSYCGWSCYDSGNYGEGMKHFLLSIEMKRIPGSFLGAGLCLERMQRFEDAKARLLEFVEMAPDHSQIGAAQEALERLKDIEVSD